MTPLVHILRVSQWMTVEIHGLCARVVSLVKYRLTVLELALKHTMWGINITTCTVGEDQNQLDLWPWHKTNKAAMVWRLLQTDSDPCHKRSSDVYHTHFRGPSTVRSLSHQVVGPASFLETVNVWIVFSLAHRPEASSPRPSGQGVLLDQLSSEGMLVHKSAGVLDTNLCVQVLTPVTVCVSMCEC